MPDFRLCNRGEISNLYHQLNMYKDITKLTGGKHYGLPLQNGEPNENGIINKHGFWIRKDWVKKLNLSLPTSTDELYAVAKAFSEKMTPTATEKKGYLRF
ncbi:MAG: hypothetical protein L6V93_21050 [Clostridiales bacterium]|nr:MAG: hypothetical protein L6V93_21050 [Clostridiales bacterium]